jgi:GTP-binding protein HflX
LEKQLENGRFNMTVRVDETKRDIAIAKFGAVLGTQ